MVMVMMIVVMMMMIDNNRGMMMMMMMIMMIDNRECVWGGGYESMGWVDRVCCVWAICCISITLYFEFVFIL